MADADKGFFDRVDAHINLSNEQTKGDTDKSQVSASDMYATARFNAWMVACNWNSGEAMAKGKQHTLDFFVEQYRTMLEENLTDYIGNFDAYMNKKK